MKYLEESQSSSHSVVSDIVTTYRLCVYGDYLLCGRYWVVRSGTSSRPRELSTRLWVGLSDIGMIMEPSYFAMRGDTNACNTHYC